jgi:starch synthase
MQPLEADRIMKRSEMNILVAASEAAPLAKVGGLGDVVGSIPLALRDLGCKVAVVLPAYREVMEGRQTWEVVAEDLPVRLGRLSLTADVLAGELAPGVPAYLVRRDEFFDRTGIYGSNRGEYFDNAERFIFFSRGILSLCSALGFLPDVILANDWQTGLIMPLLDEGALQQTAGVFVIHNLGYLGLVPPERAENIGLPAKYYRMEGPEYYGQMSLLKAGIVYAQAVVTVSPTYAREIQTPEYGAGLDGLMRSVGGNLYGILNGVDYETWNPSTDQHLAATYSPQDLAGKTLCKQELLKIAGLPAGFVEKPLVGMVTRLVDQKGCNLVAEAAEDLFALDLGLIVLGAGDESYESLFPELQLHNPGRFSLRLGFDEVFAHKMVAGCDMLLLPSLYEPCGLTQMFGLRYGTIPIVRATGGLQDTVLDPNDGHWPGTGFKFEQFRADDLVRAVGRAIAAFQESNVWHQMMRKAMAQDFSWHRSAKEYLRVFERAVAARRGEG